MKRVLSIIITLIICLSIGSCFSKSDNNNKNEKIVLNFIGGNCFSDSSVIYVKNQMMHYFDTKSKKDTIICNKPQCKHALPTKNELETNSIICDGYVDNDVATVFIYDNQLYNLCSNGSLIGKKLVRSDIDGSNKKDVIIIDGIQNILFLYFDDGFLYFSYSNSFSDDGKELEKNKSGIAYIDLKNEKLYKTPLKENYSSGTFNVYHYNNKIYSIYEYHTKNLVDENIPSSENNDEEHMKFLSKTLKSEIDCFDMSVGKTEKICDLKQFEEVVFGDNFCICKDKESNFRCINLDDNTEEKIDEDLEGYSVYAVYDWKINMVNTKTNKMINYSIKDKKIIDNIEIDNKDFSMPMLTDNYAYFLSGDSDGEYYYKRIEKNKFLSGKTGEIEKLYNPNN